MTGTKLTRTVVAGSGATLVRLTGVVDAESKADELIGDIAGDIVVDLADVRRITSFGVREWVRAVSAVPAGRLFLANCRPAIVAQLNMVNGFAGGGQVVSIFLPYACASCGEDHEVLLDLRTERNVLTMESPPPRPCPKCGEEALFDDVAASYFTMVASRPAPEVPEPVARLLGGPGDRFEIKKEVEGDLTALWLSGPLNERARFKRVTDGLEGTVVVVCAGITGGDPGGAAQLAQLLDVVDCNLYFARFRPQLFALFKPEDSAALRQRVVSFIVPATCETCGGREAVINAPAAPAGGAACLTCGKPASLPLELQYPVGGVTAPVDVDAYLLSRRAVASVDPSKLGTRVSDGAPRDMSRYHVIKPLGSGGMAEVVLAESRGPQGFQKLVVLKRILPSNASDASFVEMFLNEARVAAVINHPNVVQIYDLGEDAGHFYIAMEYVRGNDLASLIKLARRSKIDFPWPLAARIAADTLAGLHAAHTARDADGKHLEIVHRDVSPQNVLISTDGAVKIADFGISKSSSTPGMTAPGHIKGKVIYMAPEQIDAANGTVDARTDVYAAALVLHHVLTGKAFFHRSNEIASLNAALKERPPRVGTVRADIPESLDNALARGLEYDQTRRYPDAEAMRQALEQALLDSREPSTSTHVAKWIEWLKAEDIRVQAEKPAAPVVVDSSLTADTTLIDPGKISQ